MCPNLRVKGLHSFPRFAWLQLVACGWPWSVLIKWKWSPPDPLCECATSTQSICPTYTVHRQHVLGSFLSAEQLLPLQLAVSADRSAGKEGVGGRRWKRGASQERGQEINCEKVKDFASAGTELALYL